MERAMIMGGSVAAVNRLLAKTFDGRFTARAQRQHLLLEGESGNWDEIVAAGYLAAKANKGAYKGVVNDIHYTGTVAPVRMPQTQDDALEGAAPDVLVIGAGITGCAIARELTRYRLNVLLIEKECDVALHASSRNDGMVHPGLDLHRGTLKYKYNQRGNAMYDQLCEELQVDFRRAGQYLAFPGKLPALALQLSRVHWRSHGIPSMVLHRSLVGKRFPALQPQLKNLLFFPTAGNVCPYNLTIAYAENAIQNGARVSLNTACRSMEFLGDKIAAVHTNRGVVRPKVVINAAGAFAEDVAAMAGDRFFSIHPRRGTNSILDKKASKGIANGNIAAMFVGGNTVNTSAKHTKGGGVVLTAHKNLLLGPDAVETPDKEDFSTHPDSIQTVLNKQKKVNEQLHRGLIINYFTGVRAPTYEEDFVVRPGLYTKNLIHAAGIQSPGLTAAPAIAVDVALWAAKRLRAPANPEFNPVRQRIINAAALPERERDAFIRKNPDYGVILCRCEQVSRGEILEALRRPLPCDSVDGVKRRVRAGMGRCLGGFCGPLVAQVIAQELGIPLEQVRKSGQGSEILFGDMKALAGKEAGA
jgi:glycerol-3-phosphate dehydrogenase